MRRAVLIAAALASVLACTARARPPGVPAVIVEADAHSRAELAHAVRQLLGGTHLGGTPAGGVPPSGPPLGGPPVTLADDALTTTNFLSIDHANPRDAAGRPFDGRTRSRPETFELLKRGSHCLLVHVESGRSVRLAHTHCAALP